MTSKKYILEFSDYDCSHVVGIFSTAEKAKDYLTQNIHGSLVSEADYFRSVFILEAVEDMPTGTSRPKEIYEARRLKHGVLPCKDCDIYNNSIVDNTTNRCEGCEWNGWPVKFKENPVWSDWKEINYGQKDDTAV